MIKEFMQRLKINKMKVSVYVIVLIVSLLTIKVQAAPEFFDTIDYAQPNFIQEVEAEAVSDSPLDLIDTETTVYPQSDYTNIEAELPSDQIEIDTATLFSTDELLPFAQTEELYPFTHFNAYKDHFRDIATYVSYYIYYSSSLTDHYVVAPMNIIDEVVDLFSYSDLIAIQRLDINHKLRQIYFNEYSDDLIERYELKEVIPESVYADAKASTLRAEELYS